LKFFIELENQLVNSYENTKYPGQLMQSWPKRAILEVSSYVISNYTSRAIVTKTA
jgi:hypothetical protein